MLNSLKQTFGYKFVVNYVSYYCIKLLFLLLYIISFPALRRCGVGLDNFVFYLLLSPL